MTRCPCMPRCTLYAMWRVVCHVICCSGQSWRDGFLHDNPRFSELPQWHVVPHSAATAPSEAPSGRTKALLLAQPSATSFQHMLQDLLPLLAAVQPWLTANSDVTIFSNANPQLAWWLAGLGISNPLALYEFGALCSASPLLATFEVFLLQIDNWTMKYQPIALFRLLNRLLRETLSQSLKRDHQQRRAPLCIWSSRADTGARHIQNEGAAIEIMHSVCTESGLAVAVFGTEPRSHQPSALTVIAAFADATFIAGPHGGRLLHVVCAPKGAHFVEFVFVQYVNDFAHIALSLQLDYWQMPVDGMHFTNTSLSDDSVAHFAALTRCLVAPSLCTSKPWKGP